MIYLMIIEEPEDKRKFVVLYEQYRSLMMTVAREVLEDSYLAEDAVHNAFMRVAYNMNKIGDAKSQETKRYLITIVKNASIDIYRKRSKQFAKEIYVDELGEGNMPVTYMETDIENRVLDVLKNLPVKYRDVFLLKYSSRLENEEIAKICGITESAVRQRIARGKIMVEEALKKLEERGDRFYASE